MTAVLAPSLARKYHATELMGWFEAAYLFPQATMAVGFGKLSTMVKIRPYGWCWSIVMVGEFNVSIISISD